MGIRSSSSQWVRFSARAGFVASLLLFWLALAARAAEHSEEAESAHAELPNLLSIIHRLWHTPIEAWLASVNSHLPPLLHVEWVNIENVFFAFLVVAILSVFAIVVTRKRELKPKNRLYVFVENAVESVYGLFSQVLGEETRKYIPLVGTLFIYILCMNLFGLIPLMKSPTSVWGINVAMAISVFFYVQWQGIARNGVLGYVKHLIGEPRWLFFLNFPLHIIEELIKPVSLSLRLFGNILGEDTLLAVFAGLMFLIPGFVKLPLHFPFLFLALIFSTIQALIFSMLTAVYILLMLPREEHAH